MFRFKLEPILRLRKLESNKATRELASAKMELRGAVSELITLKGKQQRLLDEYAGEGVKADLDIEELKLRAYFLQKVRAFIATEQQRVEELEREFDEKRQELIEALKRENILKRLKSRRHFRYLKEEERKERMFFDEVAGRRHAKIW